MLLLRRVKRVHNEREEGAYRTLPETAPLGHPTVKVLLPTQKRELLLGTLVGRLPVRAVLRILYLAVVLSPRHDPPLLARLLVLHLPVRTAR